jgi:hypothetical protein
MADSGKEEGGCIPSEFIIVCHLVSADIFVYELLLWLLSFIVDNMEKYETNSRITFMFRILTSLNIKNEFIILELSYSVKFILISEV